MKTKFTIFLYIAVIMLCLNISAAAETLEDLKVYTVPEKTEIYAGGSGLIILKIKIPDKHYIYANPKGPGIGRPTTVDINRSDNFTIDNVKYSASKKYTALGDPNFVYIFENETKIEIPFTARKNSKPGVYKISLLLKTLLCSDKACIPQSFNIEHPVKVTSTNPENTIIKASQYQNSVIRNPENQNKNTALINSLPSFKPIFLREFSVSNIIHAILFGLLAGFILNFMPCVLPVISIKILDIIKFSGEDKKEIKKHGLVFTLGILTSFSVLAFLAAFLEYSWGGLFQNSVFLIIMITVVFVLALSMFEIFTINIPSFAGNTLVGLSNKYLQTYSKGLLATLLATPCSGPFLGGTLAWASTQSYIVIFTVFISIGIGMALPYIILPANPRLMKFIPKPGDWMVVFENIMAFLLLGTVVYLISILKQSLIMPTLWLLLFVGIAFWQYGKFGSLIKPVRSRIISKIAVIIIIVSGYFLIFNYFYSNEQKIEISKNNFSLSLLNDNKENDKVSIVNFTADWCPNCKLVEKLSLNTKKVKDSINKTNIDFLYADLTEENPDATALLSKLGSRSIPFLAVFPAGKNFVKPICLRDIYSEDDVLKAIEMAKEESR